MSAEKCVKYQIIRETGNIYDKNASWLNRYVQDPETKVTSLLSISLTEGNPLLLRVWRKT